MEYANIKWNDGKGALLCSNCNVIIGTGFEWPDKHHYCGECTPEQTLDQLIDEKCDLAKAYIEYLTSQAIVKNNRWLKDAKESINLHKNT